MQRPGLLLVCEPEPGSAAPPAGAAVWPNKNLRLFLFCSQTHPKSVTVPTQAAGNHLYSRFCRCADESSIHRRWGRTISWINTRARSSDVLLGGPDIISQCVQNQNPV